MASANGEITKKILSVIVIVVTLIAFSTGAVAYIHSCVSGVRADSKTTYATKERLNSLSCEIENLRDDIKTMRSEQREDFRLLADKLEDLETFNTEASEHIIRDLCESLGIKPGLLINAVRTATTGQQAGPGLFDILTAIGQERTVRRLRKIADDLEKGKL